MVCSDSDSICAYVTSLIIIESLVIMVSLPRKPYYVLADSAMLSQV